MLYELIQSILKFYICPTCSYASKDKETLDFCLFTSHRKKRSTDICYYMEKIENITVSVRSQTQNVICGMIPFI